MLIVPGDIPQPLRSIPTTSSPISKAPAPFCRTREIGLARVKHEVIVVSHQAVRQHRGVEPARGLFSDPEQRAPIVIVGKNRFAPVASRSDAENRSGELDAKGTGHRVDVGKWEAKGKI